MKKVQHALVASISIALLTLGACKKEEAPAAPAAAGAGAAAGYGQNGGGGEFQPAGLPGKALRTPAQQRQTGRPLFHQLRLPHRSPVGA